MSDQDLIYVRERRLPYETFDSDNHLYENQDALTKFLPKEYEGAVKYVEVNGRTKLAHPRPHQRVHPQPDLQPGGGARAAGATRRPTRDTAAWAAATGVKPKVMPGIDAFFDPEPRLALMKDMGIDRTLLWPTLASVLEERVADDPDLPRSRSSTRSTSGCTSTGPTCTPDAIYATPIISLAAGAGTRDRGAAVRPASAAPRSSSSAWRRCPRGRAASRSRCPSSTRSGPRSSGSTSSSACTPATRATSATSTSGRASPTRCCRSRPRAPRRSRRWRPTRTWCTTRWRRSSATASPLASRR